MKPVLFLAISIIAFSFTHAQSDTSVYRERIAMLQKNISTHFYDSKKGYYKEFNKRDSNDHKQFSFLWPLCALVQAANETEVLGLSSISMKSVMTNIQDYHDTRAPAPGYAAYIAAIERDDRFYDDNQWVGIACMDAYERTGDRYFLSEGEKVYRFMMTGYDTVSGGGLYWKEGDMTTKNTCSNGPGVIVALQLYKASGTKAYLDTALMLYNWTNRYLLSSEGVYYDNLQLPAVTVDKRTYTYNTGTMLESNVLLYELTSDKKYLEEAKRLAKSAHKYFYRNNRFPGNTWFNAVLLRGYLALQRHEKNTEYIAAFANDMEQKWKDRDSYNLLGRRPKKELIEQASSLEIYSRLLQYRRGIN